MGDGVRMERGDYSPQGRRGTPRVRKKSVGSPATIRKSWGRKISEETGTKDFERKRANRTSNLGNKVRSLSEQNFGLPKGGKKRNRKKLKRRKRSRRSPLVGGLEGKQSRGTGPTMTSIAEVILKLFRG